MIDDAELLRRYAEEKSEAAFAELVRRRIGLVYSVALRHTHDAQRAEDVAQRVFTDLARKAEKLAGRGVLIGWLYRSAQFAASDAVRAESRRHAREREVQTMNEIERTAREPDWNKLHPVLDEILNGMDDRDRDVVLLRFFDGRPFGEIGAKLRVTENAARMRVERALEKMRVALARRGVTSTSAALSVALASQAGAAAPAGLAASVVTAVLGGMAVARGASLMAKIFAFMSTTKMTLGVAGVLALTAIGTLVRYQQQTHMTREALLALERERDHLIDRVHALEKRPKASAPVAKAPLPSVPVSAPTAGSNELDAGALAELDRLVAGNPELQRLYVGQQTARLRSNYGPFYRSADLTRVQIEKFERAFAIYAQASVEVPAVAVGQGLEKNDPAVATAFEAGGRGKGTFAARDAG